MRALALLSALAALSCSDSVVTTTPHVARTTGGAVALSHDERIALVTNRNAGLVTVLSLKPERGLNNLVSHTEVLELPADAEPWAAIVGADDDTAYVVLKKRQEVVCFKNLRGKPVEQGRVNVGSEPSSVALSPSGRLLFVANWGDGTVSKIDTQSLAETPLDLNRRLVDEGVLGDVQPRLGLAHPRALAITDDGDQDDGDETLFVTEFFSQPIPERGREPADVDTNRQGFVYSYSLGASRFGPTMPISPVQRTGFADSRGHETGCFPNQLQAASVVGNRLYVTAMCTSPAGPREAAEGEPKEANFKTLLHPAVFALNVESQEEVPAEGRLLTRVLQDAYDADQTPDDETRRMPLSPQELVFRDRTDGGRDGYLLALGADSVFRLEYDSAGALQQIGSSGHRYLATLAPHGYAIGLALSQRSSPAFGLALSDGAQQLAVLNLEEDRVLQPWLPSTAHHPRAEELLVSRENNGRGLFAAGTSVWSLRGQAWSSCESCHPGGLSDGVTWYFARGPRRTLSPANTYEKGRIPEHAGRRLLLWGANADEVADVEVIVRSVSGGSGAVPWKYDPNGAPSNDCRIVFDPKPSTGSNAGRCRAPKPSSSLLNGLNGSLSLIIGGTECSEADEVCDSTFDQDWNDLDAYLRSLRVPQPPSRLSIGPIKAGRGVFERAGCQDCHGGPQWTTSTLFYEPSATENGIAPRTAPTEQTAAQQGRLRQDLYRVPEALIGLNPVAAREAKDGCQAGSRCATIRPPLDQAYTPQGGDDQLRCALRAVGTYPAMGLAGVVPPGEPAPRESRAKDDLLAAQGADGFNVPSLFGLGVGAPYFHAGNARTLEELFDPAFAAHYTAVRPGFVFEGSDRDNLVTFLLSLDAQSPSVEPAPELRFCTTRGGQLAQK